MPRRTPTTIHLDPHIAKAIRVKSAVSGRSMSDLVNESLLALLRRDDAIREIFRKRRHMKGRPYEEVVAEMKANGQL